MNNTSELLKEMATLTVASNRISEIQLKNLNVWPFCYFNGVKEVRIDYDLSHKADVMEDELDNKLIINAPTRNSFVAYYLTLEDGAENHHIEERFKALESSVRTLFWNDVTLEVYINDQIKYKSKKV